MGKVAIAARLRLLRDSLGYSQEGAAALAGLPQRTWSRWEREPPDALDHLAVLAQRAGVSADWLLGLAEEARPAGRRGEQAEAWPAWAGDALAALRGMTEHGRALALAALEAAAREDRAWRRAEALAAADPALVDEIEARLAVLEAAGMAPGAALLAVLGEMAGRAGGSGSAGGVRVQDAAEQG